LVSTTKATKNFTKSEMVTIKKSDVVIRQAVADNWEKTQQLLGQWPEVIEIFEREPLVRSDLKQYNGNLISQQELRSKLGCKDKTIFAKLRRAVQTKYPLSEKWFIRCQDQGNPIFFQVEHFDEYQQLWASVSQKPKAEVVKKTTKVEVVKETTKVEVVEEAAKVEVIEEPKRVDMLTVRGWAEFVGWLDVSCEQALQDTIDAEEEYKKAESEAHQSKGPSERAKLLVAACEKNQAVLDSTEEFNKKSADVEIAKALTKEKEQADEEVRKALEKVEQIKAKMNALMAEYGTYEM